LYHFDDRRQEIAKATAAAASNSAIAAAQASAAAAAKGKGSEWNSNSYHWEEKPLTGSHCVFRYTIRSSLLAGWASDRLKQLIDRFDIDVPGGTVKIVEVGSGLSHPASPKMYFNHSALCRPL
jgi:hypothetical protein